MKQTVDAIDSGFPSSLLDGTSLGNRSDVNFPLKVSYAKNLGLTLDDVDLALIVGSTFAHQEMFLTANQIAEMVNTTSYGMSASYQIFSHTDVNFEMRLPKEGNYSVNDDLLTSPRETRKVTVQIDFRLAMYSEAVVVFRKSDNNFISFAGHLKMKSEMTIKGSNLPVAIINGDHTNLTYQDVNGSTRSMADLNYSLRLDPEMNIVTSGNSLKMMANASLAMDLSGFIDATGIPQNIEDELFGRTLATYGIFSLPVHFEDIDYLTKAIDRSSLSNQTVPFEMTMSCPDSTGPRSIDTVLEVGGSNSTFRLSIEDDKLVGITAHNPWHGSVSSLGLSTGPWILSACNYDQAKEGMNLTQGMIRSMPSSIYGTVGPSLNDTKETINDHGGQYSNLLPFLAIIILLSLVSVLVIVYRRKR